MWRTLALMMCAALAACDSGAPATTPVASEWSDVRAPVTITDWPLPTLRPGTHSPALSATKDGRLLLSWVNSQRGRRPVFQFSAYDPVHQRWRGTPLTVVIGSSLYIDPELSPRVIASRDGALWAQWWQGGKPDVMFSRSRDGGANWSEPQTPDPDPERIGSGQMAVLAWPEGEREIGMAWMGEREDGSVSLRAARIDASGTPAPAVTLDLDLDEECEPPGVAQTARGPLLAWRGWDANARRKALQVVRHDASGWTMPVQIDLDDGGMSHCFNVNGTLIAARDEAAVVVWSTLHDHEDKGELVIRAAVSADAGDRFSAPVEIDLAAGMPFAVVMDARQVWILWIQGDDDKVFSLWLSRRSLDLQEEYERREIVRLPGYFSSPNSAPGSRPNSAPEHALVGGLPQFVLSRGTGWLVWSEARGTGTNLRGVKILPAREL